MEDYPAIAQDLLKEDPRVLVTPNRQIFETAADRHAFETIRLCVFERPDAIKSTLKEQYKKVGQLYRTDTSIDLTTRVQHSNGDIKMNVPDALIKLGLEMDLLETASTYARLSGLSRFDLRPSTVVNARSHPHAIPVLSISWGGAGLAIDKNINGRDKETFQLQEGDFGYLKPNMLHRSPYKSAPGRFVMFVAPPKGMS